MPTLGYKDNNGENTNPIPYIMKDSTALVMPNTTATKVKKNRPLELYHELLEEFQRARFGYATIAIIGQSCLGSAAAMFLLMSGLADLPKMGLLFLVTIFCMAFNGAVLANLNAKITFNILIISVLFSFAVIIGMIAIL